MIIVIRHPFDLDVLIPPTQRRRFTRHQNGGFPWMHGRIAHFAVELQYYHQILVLLFVQYEDNQIIRVRSG